MESLQQGEIGLVRAAFGMLERFVTKGDPETQNAAVIGLIEGIQNHALSVDCRLEAFEPLLQPQSRKAWNDLNGFWEGENAEKKEVGCGGMI